MTDEITRKAFVVWASRVEAGYCSLSDVTQWADEQITARDHPPDWLLDLSLASSLEEAARLLRCGSEQELCSPGDVYPSQRWGELYLGFLFLRYERGELVLAELLKLAGQKSDGTECGIDWSAFYLLLNEIDGGGPVTPSDRPLSDRVREVFIPFAGLAQKALPLNGGPP